VAKVSEVADVAIGAVRIAVMARAPVAGFAKTRLAPALGAAGAAALAARLLQHAVQQAVAARLGAVTVWATPDASHPAFVQAQREHGVSLAVQGAGDVGERMSRVFDQAFDAFANLAEGSTLGRATGNAPGTAADTAPGSTLSTALRPALGPLLLMGTDIPGLTARVLQSAAAALAQHDAVLVPALDGGYALLGLHAAAPSLFNGMVWSTAQVLAQTRLRLAAAGLRHHELPALADIDEPNDLQHLPPGWLSAADMLQPFWQQPAAKPGPQR
jgi:uncharacterized protein